MSIASYSPKEEMQRNLHSTIFHRPLDREGGEVDSRSIYKSIGFLSHKSEPPLSEELLNSFLVQLFL